MLDVVFDDCVECGEEIVMVNGKEVCNCSFPRPNIKVIARLLEDRDFRRGKK